ncbi:MAG: hypothetical protein ACERLG_05175, partial [Sedimentibacter sp.]
MNSSIYKKGLAVVLIIALFIMTAVGIKLSSKENDINYTCAEDMGGIIDEDIAGSIDEDVESDYESVK